MNAHRRYIASNNRPRIVEPLTKLHNDEELKLRYYGHPSRQTLRNYLFREAFYAITRQYPGESHKLRREMARINAKNSYRKMTKGDTNEQATQG